MSIGVCDVMLSTADADGSVRVNIGNSVDGVGYGASVPLWGTDGFLSRPNAATSAGTAQALYMTQGNSRRVFATRDGRWAVPFGALGEGDRAIVSNCDAGLWLDKSANAIRLASTGGATVVAGPSSVVLTFGGCTVTLADGALTLEYAATAGGIVVSSIVLDVAGVAITGGAVTVNGIPVP